MVINEKRWRMMAKGSEIWEKQAKGQTISLSVFLPEPSLIDHLGDDDGCDGLGATEDIDE